MTDTATNHPPRLTDSVDQMTDAQIASLTRSMSIKMSNFVPTYPSPKQLAFHLLENTLEVLFGGAAGGGKSEALLQGAARHVDNVPVNALLIRRTYKDLAQQGGLMARSHEWFKGTQASWDGINYKWRFPSGASISFGYLENENDHLRYQGGEYQYIGFDELTQIREHQYLYLFSRLRRLSDFPIPLQMRAATNPGGPGHEWVRKRWNLPDGPTGDLVKSRKYLPATLDDNPHLNQEEYADSLSRLADVGTDVTYQQLRFGDWAVKGTGGFFHPENFILLPPAETPSPTHFSRVIRYWDLGTTEVTELNPDPDWTVGIKMAESTYTRPHTVRDRTGKSVTVHLPDYFILDLVRVRLAPGGIESTIRQTAMKDGVGVAVWLEEERGAAGKNLVWQYRTYHLPGHLVRGMRVEGNKETRGKHAAARVDEKRVFLLDASWTTDFLAECGSFPEGEHDDQVDTFSYGLVALEREKRMEGGGRIEQPRTTGKRKVERKPMYGWS